MKFLLGKSIGKKSNDKNITLKIRQKIEGKKITRQNFAVESPSAKNSKAESLSFKSLTEKIPIKFTETKL